MIVIEDIEFSSGEVKFSIVNQFDELGFYSIGFIFDPSEVDLSRLFITGPSGGSVAFTYSENVQGYEIRIFESADLEIAYAYNISSGYIELSGYSKSDRLLPSGEILLNLSFGLRSSSDTSVSPQMWAYLSGLTSDFELPQTTILLQGITNDPPTGDVSILIPQGTVPYVGQTLLASNTIDDADGLGEITYTWKADNIIVATGSTFTVSKSEIGKTITVTASYTDAKGNSEVVVSEPLASVLNNNSPPTGSIAISGIPIQGQTLIAVDNLADADGIDSVNYTWEADGTTIGTGIAYTLNQTDVGKAITVIANYIDNGSTFESVTSQATSIVENINDSPTGSVTITGVAAIGEILTASNSLNDIDGLGLIAYTWVAEGETVGFGATYTPKLIDIGKSITVIATYTDGGNTVESVASAATEVVVSNRLPTGMVTISGAAEQGQTLSASNTLADADGLGAITYTWQANGETLITGAKLKLLQSEVGKIITVTASYIDGSGTVENVSSAPTATVSNVNDAPVLTPKAPNLISITEDDIDNQGQTVASILGSSLKDIDVDPKQGIAITGATGINGAWQFSLDAGVNWSDVGTASASAALLLRDTDHIRWKPDGKLGTTATIDYLGWDQTNGVAGTKATINAQGGTSAFSILFDKSQLTVVDNNDPPTIYFGSGKVITDVGSTDSGNDVVLQPDGKILVAGTTSTGSFSQIAVVRYNPDGTLDTTFSGDGKLTTAIGSRDDIGSSIALQPDGRILVAGRSYNGTNYDFALVRYNTDGNLDTTFSGGGKLTTAIGSGDDIGSSIALQPDGKILVAGWSYNGTNDDFALVRYNPDGTLDTTFSGDGKLTTAIGSSNEAALSIALQSDGKILVAGYSSIGNRLYFTLVRYLSTGNLDLSFDSDGKITTAIGSGNDYAASVALQPDGKILVAGHSSSNGEYDYALVRYNTDGSLDATLDGDGKLTTDFDNGIDYGKSIEIQPDSKIIIAGTKTAKDYDFGVARYNADGTLDGSFHAKDFKNSEASYIEDGEPTRLSSEFSIFDIELESLGSYAGARVSIFRLGGSHPDDIFGLATGQNSNLAKDEILQVSGQPIGRVVLNSGGELQIEFAHSATRTLISLAMRDISYLNISDSPPDSVDIQWNFSDGNTGPQGNGGALTATGVTTVKISPVEDEAVGSLNIAGTAISGSNLAAVLVAVDPDGAIVDTSFQWQELLEYTWVELLRNDAANASIAIPSDGSFVGKKLRVLSTTTDSMGGETLFVSDVVQVGLPTSLVEVSAQTWKTKSPMVGVDVSIGSQQLTTDSGGLAEFSSAAASAASVSASVAVSSVHYTDASASVTLQDAVSILRMIAGQPADVSPASRFQSLAADFDGSGTVSLADALGVLRHTLGRPAPAPSWVFVEEGDDALPSILNPGVPGPVTVDVTPPGPIEVNLIGVLRGDVDGSYGVYGG